MPTAVESAMRDVIIAPFAARDVSFEETLPGMENMLAAQSTLNQASNGGCRILIRLALQPSQIRTSKRKY